MRIFSFLALMALVFPGNPAFSAGLSDAEILRNFETIAFGDEFRVQTDPRLRKWTGPLRVWMQQDAALPEADADFLRGHIDRLRGLTGLNIDAAKSEQDSNFLIVFTSREDYFDTALDRMNIDDPVRRAETLGYISGSSCLGFYKSDRETSEIFQAIAVIPVDPGIDQDSLVHCIVEETVQVLGLPNDSDDIAPSIFNDTSLLNGLFEHDMTLLRLLYHPRMRAGLRPDEARAVAEEILPGIRAALAGQAPGDGSR